MPRYTYECETCKEVFDLVHSMSHKPTERDECEKECVLNKIPAKLTILNSKSSESGKKVGTVVKNSIEEFKKDLKQEKRRLQRVEYKEDD
tara:strand:- start:15553 stop:15822 length:270 start_codon:yes stop_codon:yes gene_type:complete